jgi:hypothetical protein
MPYQTNHRTQRPQPQMDAAKLDALLIDDDFDDTLDRQIAGLRESLADFRNL